MVSQITLGSFSTQNGKNVLTGGASGLDTTAIVDALAKAKRAPAVRLETKNKAIDDQTAALAKMKTLLNSLQTASDTLRNPPGVGVDSKNIFQYRTANVTSSTGVAASNYMDVAVQPGAVAQSYTLDSITQLAKATKQKSNVISVADTTSASAVTASGSPTPGLFQAGTVNLRAVDGTAGGIPLTLSSGDTLSTVAQKFNDVSSRTGIQATIITVANGSYQIVFSATKTGTTYGFDLSQTAPAAGAGIQSDPSGVLSQMTFGVGTGNVTAQNAIFSIDGISLNRESNSVSDVISGLTLTLKQDTVPGSLLINVTPDTTLVKNAITQFADAYNALKLFAATQTELKDDGTPKDTAVLYNDSTFRTIMNNVGSEVSRVVSGITGTNPSQLVDIGITLDNFAGDDTNPATKDIMTVDTDSLAAKLLSNFDGVRQMFQYQQIADDSNFVNSTRSNNLSATSYTVNIDTATNTYTATYNDPVSGATTVNLTGTPISGGGVSLVGQTGTIFEGSTFVYAGSNTTATVNVTATQGFGDRFYNLTGSITDKSSGTLTLDVNDLTDQKTRNTADITAIDDKITAYRDQLTTQYAQLEAAISSANSILSLLDAQSNANKGS